MTRRAWFLVTCAAGLAACSDPIPPAPQGAMAVKVSPNSLGDPCQSSGVPFNIPEDFASRGTSSGKARLHDGQNGDTTVSCKVTGSSVAACITKKSRVEFHVQNGSISGGTGTADITEWNAPPGGSGGSNLTGLGCTLKVNYIEAGAIWASFSCPDFSDPSQPSNKCAVREDDGEFVLENCATSGAFNCGG